MNIIVIIALSAALALIVAAFCGWAQRVGYEAGRQAGREERAVSDYAAGYADATKEIGLRVASEEQQAFMRGYQKCMRDCGIDEEEMQEVQETSVWQPAQRLVATA